MKTLLIAAACIPLLAACNKDEPAPETTAPAVEAPAVEAPAAAVTAPPAEALPPATDSTEATATSTTTPVTTPAAEPAMEASGSSLGGASEGSGGGTYVVDRGDTLWSIAEKNGIAHGDLAKWNNINDPRELQVGRKLTLSAP